MTTYLPINPGLTQKRWVNTTDLNIKGFLFGGRLLTWVDGDASILVAESIDEDFVTGRVFFAEFRETAKLGERLTFEYTIVHLSHATMTIRANVHNNHNEDVFCCYITFVAVKDGKATAIHCKTDVPDYTASWAFVERYRKFIQEG